MPYRLFFALWPDANTQEQIQQCMDVYEWPPNTKPVPKEDWHVTLNFIGDVNEVQYQNLLQIPLFNIPAFNLVLNTVEYWSTAKVLVLQADEIPSALQQLVQKIQQILSQEKLEIIDKEYKPHLTLVRKMALPSSTPTRLLTHPISFPVKNFCLANSYERSIGNAQAYQILKTWDLL